MYYHNYVVPKNNEIEGKFPCDKCGKVFINRLKLSLHNTSVHKEKVSCEKCGKLFKERAKLKEHFEIVHEQKPPKGKKCTECEMVFAFRHQMCAHRNKVHFTTKFQCETCKRSFGIGSSLKRHIMVVHSGERNFPCDECGRKLKQKKDLLEHKRAHSGEKPYACQYCPYRGTSSSLLYHHKKQRHKVEYVEEKMEKERAKPKIAGAVEKERIEADS